MPNVIDPVTRNATTRPDATAVIGDSTPLSYAQLHDAALRYAAALRATGVGRDDRVLLAAPSVPEFAVAYLGVQAVGATIVTVNTMSTVAELDYFLGDSEAALAIGHGSLGTMVAESAAAAGIPFWELDASTISPSDRPQASVSTPVDRKLSETAAILYTSGTTGKPKGAELTVGNLLAAGEVAAQVSHGTADDRLGTGLPLFHVFGQASVMMAAFTSGASMSLLGRFTPRAMIDMLTRDRLTVVCGVPTMWNAMLHEATDADADGFAHLRVAVSGGASLPGEIARAFEQRFGCTLLEGYGLTETTAMATFNDIDRGGKVGSTGSVVPRMRVEIRDVDGVPCAPGTVGEVVIAGDMVFTGYWRNPEASAAALSPDGWFRTGDLGEFDADGDLRIVDRMKDLIIRGGYNVYPGEVEEVLYAHPDVVEAAVIGVPDTHYGEEVAALVALTPDSTAGPDAIESWCRERLSAYKIPRIIRFVDQLPKGSTGKILKRSIDRTQLRRTTA